MKTIQKILLAVIIALTSANIFAQCPGKYGMSIQPGQLSNTATFSYRTGHFQPYAGIQMMNLGASLNSEWQEFNSSGRLVDAFDRTSLNLRIFIPQIGCRYNFKSSEQFTLFANAGLSTVMMRGNSSAGVTQPTMSDVLKNNKIFGAQAGFGAEYFFNKHFSIGGEYGIRTMQIRNTTTYNNDIMDPTSGDWVTSKRTESVKFVMTPTFAKLFFSFYL